MSATDAVNLTVHRQSVFVSMLVFFFIRKLLFSFLHSVFLSNVSEWTEIIFHFPIACHVTRLFPLPDRAALCYAHAQVQGPKRSGFRCPEQDFRGKIFRVNLSCTVFWKICCCVFVYCIRNFFGAEFPRFYMLFYSPFSQIFPSCKFFFAVFAVF